MGAELAKRVVSELGEYLGGGGGGLGGQQAPVSVRQVCALLGDTEV